MSDEPTDEDRVLGGCLLVILFVFGLPLVLGALYVSLVILKAMFSL